MASVVSFGAYFYGMEDGEHGIVKLSLHVFTENFKIVSKKNKILDKTGHTRLLQITNFPPSWLLNWNMKHNP